MNLKVPGSILSLAAVKNLKLFSTGVKNHLSLQFCETNC